MIRFPHIDGPIGRLRRNFHELLIHYASLIRQDFWIRNGSDFLRFFARPKTYPLRDAFTLTGLIEDL